jgi:hypothetical protein
MLREKMGGLTESWLRDLKIEAERRAAERHGSARRLHARFEARSTESPHTGTPEESAFRASSSSAQ